MDASGFPLLLFLDYYHGPNTNFKDVNKTGYFTVLGLIIGYFLAMGYSRIYLAAHTLDNLILGWELGIWTALFFHLFIRENLVNHIEKVRGSNRNYIALLILEYLLIATAIYVAC